MTPKVSIVTVTQWKRREFVRFTLDFIAEQTYSNIVEWVIVDGSKENDDQQRMKTEILSWPHHPKITRRYISSLFLRPDERTIGRLRNLYHESGLKGDIIVCFDDDDYYPPSRVSHAVQKLETSDTETLIAGCSNHIMYDMDTDRIYRFGQFAPYHSVNLHLAYRKEYIEHHRYENHARNAEEAHFLNKFSSKMVQLDPRHSGFQISHYGNTFSKRKIIINTLNGRPTNCRVDPSMSLFSMVKHKKFRQFLEKYASKHEKLESAPDIVYYTGDSSIQWDPEEQSLGGSEQAVVELSTLWVQKHDKTVQVYGNFAFEEKEYQGVIYRSFTKFCFRRNYHHVILWRMFGATLLNGPLKAKHIIYDVHDRIDPRIKDTDVLQKSHVTVFKSEFHFQLHKHVLKEEMPEKEYYKILNGLRIEQFRAYPDQCREPKRFVYCSCYTRGLEPLLKYTWPLLYHYHPDAELHVYYGMEHVRDEEWKKRMEMLLKQPGIYDHGRQSVNEIIHEKSIATFHLYYTCTMAEIDCISIRESLLRGCIPILANVNVFREREGIHYDFGFEQKGYYQLAKAIHELLQHDSIDINKLRERYSQSRTIQSWRTTSDFWIKNVFKDP